MEGQTHGRDPSVERGVLWGKPKQLFKLMHEHIIRCPDLKPDGGPFRVAWHPSPSSNLLQTPAVVTYVPAHGGWFDGGTSGLGVSREWHWLADFGQIGGRAVVLDACNTASDQWLYDQGKLRDECRNLVGKALLGGSGSSMPNARHAPALLASLIEELRLGDAAGMNAMQLRDLLDRALDRAARARPRCNWTAYKTRIVSSRRAHCRG